MNIRLKAIIFVQLTIVLLSGVYLALAISHQHQDLQNIIQTKQNNSLFLANQLQDQAFAHYETRIVSLTTTKKKVITSFAQRDHEALYRAMAPIYTLLQKENPHFSNILFSLPDGTTFLRMHAPDFRGDNLNEARPLIKNTHLSQQQTAGYEVGHSGLFFTISQPIFWQEQYIGSISFGIQHDQLLKLLRSQISPHIALSINSEKWKVATSSKRQAIHKKDKTILPMGSELMSILPLDINANTPASKIHFQNKIYTLLSNITLKGYHDTTIARVLIALDITEDVKHLNHFVIKMIILTIILILTTSLVLHFSFGKLLNTIIDLNHSLTHSNENLEKRVQQRTAELSESNISLKKEIIERQRLESSLLQTEKMRTIGSLSSGIAHDFNNILTAILGYNRLAILKQKNHEDSTPFLEEVENASLRAQDLVAQILTFSRKSDNKSQSIKLAEIIEKTLKLLQVSIPNSIQLTTQIDPDCCPVFANSTKLHQIIMNICTNAHHAMFETGGTLSISLCPITITSQDEFHDQPPGEYNLLSIDDTGIGMDTETQKRIFEPYFTTKEEGQGTGLGMALVQNIVKSYNGFITVHSNLGEGTSFKIYLPCHNEKQHNQIDLPHDKSIVMGKGEHILVVDDEKSLLVLWEALLNNLGYTVTVMEDSIIAYHWLSNRFKDIDVVISDLAMPKLNGAELSKKIFTIAPDIPVILCSGSTDLKKYKQDENINSRAFIKKPIDNVLLSQVLHKILGQPPIGKN